MIDEFSAKPPRHCPLPMPRPTKAGVVLQPIGEILLQICCTWRSLQ
jgi:hypothetical protein